MSGYDVLYVMKHYVFCAIYYLKIQQKAFKIFSLISFAVNLFFRNLNVIRKQAIALKHFSFTNS